MFAVLHLVSFLQRRGLPSSLVLSAGASRQPPVQRPHSRLAPARTSSPSSSAGSSRQPPVQRPHSRLAPARTSSPSSSAGSSRQPPVPRPLRWALALLIGWSLLGSAQAQEPAAEKVDFIKQVKPIFEQHCLKCHGPDKEEDFRIDDRDAAMDYIIPGKAKESQMYEVLVSDDEEELMPPPDEKNPLKPEQIKLIERWIDEGADWPDGVEFKQPEEKQGGAGSEPAEKPAAGAEPLLDEPAAEKPAVQPGVGQTSSEATQANQAQGEAAQEMTQSGESSQTGAPAQDEPQGADQPQAEKKSYSVFNAIGSLHPAILHLPIGLLFAAGLFSLIGIRGNFVMSDCAYYCLWLGTFGAVLACVSGWWFSPMEGRGTVSTVQDLWNQQHPIFWHRTSALVMTFLAIGLCLFARSARLRDPDDGFLWKLGALLLAVGIGFVGHNGGELTHGKNLYRDLNGLIEQSTGWDLDGK